MSDLYPLLLQLRRRIEDRIKSLPNAKEFRLRKTILTRALHLTNELLASLRSAEDDEFRVSEKVAEILFLCAAGGL